MHRETNYNKKEMIERLKALRDSDVDGFINLVMSILQDDPKGAVDDIESAAKKLKALDLIMKYLEQSERFEDCAFIRDLSKKIIAHG